MFAQLCIREEQLNEICEATKQDEVLKHLADIIVKGWPESWDILPVCLNPYFFISKAKLTVQDGSNLCFMMLYIYFMKETGSGPFLSYWC